MVRCGATLSSLENNCRLISMFSTMASMTRSAVLPASSTFVVCTAKFDCTTFKKGYRLHSGQHVFDIFISCKLIRMALEVLKYSTCSWICFELLLGHS